MLALMILGIVSLIGLTASVASAAEETYIVDNTGDAAGGACVTATPADCSLRSAIEKANASAGELDLISFDFSIFTGVLPGSRITLGSALPAITSQLLINGSSCVTAVPADLSPCVEVVAPSTSVSVLTVDNTDNSSINGLSLTGGQFGIDVINSSQALTITNNWIGVKLDGTAGGNEKAGIFIDPDSNGAAIGGQAVGQRNVISNNGVGVDVMGADNTSIQGNYIGVKPDGVTAAGNAKGIEITDSTAAPGFTAQNSDIGAALFASEAPTNDCDKGCNVISGSQYGIDLNGDGGEEVPASGPTKIHSNYVGLAAGGLTAVPNTEFGILVGAAKNVTIGGLPTETTFRNTNLIAGGSIAIFASKAEALGVYLNSIGRNASGDPVAAPSSFGIYNSSQGVTEPAIIQLNGIRMVSGYGIGQSFAGSQILQNSIEGAQVGILTKVSSGDGSLIEGNGINGSSLIGILVEDDANEVLGNTITESGEAGIRIQTPENAGTLPSTGNLIGGSSSDQNTISESGGPAIEISNLEESDNEIGPNTGFGNGGPFIDLVSANPVTDPDGPNHGIKPPTISSASTTEIAGTAEPGAKVLVFRKASAAPGELEELAGEATADGGGAWKVPVTLPDGTNIAALQTSTTGGSSELALTTAEAAEPEEKGDGGGGGGKTDGGKPGKPKDNGKGKAKGRAKDKTPPDTRITKGPPKRTHKRRAVFKFVSTEAGSTFQCKLDRKPWKTCRSPKKYKKLKPRKHVFKVRAIDAAGNVDPTPAVKRFKVLK